MKWAHLPVGGGLYDQHPKFMDDVFLIMNIEGEHHRQQAERERRKQSKKPGMASSGHSRRRR